MSSTAHQNHMARSRKGAQKCAKRAVALALEQMPTGVLSGAPGKLTAMIYEIVELSNDCSYLLELIGSTREERLVQIEWAIRSLIRRRVVAFTPPPVPVRRGRGKVRKDPSASLRLKTAPTRRWAAA